MDMDLGDFMIRPWTMRDEASLLKYANNKNISKNLRDAFPFPYTAKDAKNWLEMSTGPLKDLNFAIEVHGEAVGGIGLNPGKDISSKDAEIGYWLAEPLWGRGIVTRGVGAMTAWAFSELGMVRVHAAVFETNPASARVLEKNGFVLEGRLRKSVVKDGRVMDSLLYAKVK